MGDQDVTSAQSRRRESGRALACLFTGGGALGIVIDVLVPPADIAGVIIPCLVAIAVGVALWRISDKLGPRQLAVALALGSTLITIGVASASDVRSDDQMLYLWATTYAFFTLPVRWALGQTAYVAASYALVLLVRHEPTGLPRWLITITTLLITGLFVARVVRRLDALVSRGAEREAALREAEARFRSAFEDAAVGMALVGLDGCWLEVNEALARLTGYPRRSLIGMSFRELTPAEDVGRDIDALSRLVRGEISTHHAEKRYIRADGSVVWVALSVSVLRDPEGHPEYLISQMQDITARREAEAELARQAFHDPLTGLPNRRLFNDRVELALARMQRSRESVAVLFVDLDAFKLVNDSLGHEVGDRLLVAVAARLRGQLRPADTIARFGGDEFTVVCEGTDESRAQGVANRLLASLARPFAIDDRELFVTASIGISVRADCIASAEEMLRDADAAMYRAKDQGRSRHAIFDGAMHRRASDRLELENDLRRALAQDEFELVYQPDIELSTGRIAGVEALLRWRHPRRGLLLPGEFITAAEESGLIGPLGVCVVWEACRQASCWQQDGHALAVAINISPRQLTDGRLRDAVAEALSSTDARPELLTLEITETAAAHALGSEIDALRTLGVRLAIDDFGSGFASLNQVRSLPTADTLKIDRIFTGELGRRPADDAIVAAIVSIARALNMDTVMEGIETPLQAEAATRLGCDRGQGYHFGRPMAPALIGLRLEAGQPEAAQPAAS